MAKPKKKIQPNVKLDSWIIDVPNLFRHMDAETSEILELLAYSLEHPVTIADKYHDMADIIRKAAEEVKQIEMDLDVEIILEEEK